MKSGNVVKRLLLVLPSEIQQLLLRSNTPNKLRNFACWCADEAASRAPATEDLFRSTVGVARSFSAGKAKAGQMRKAAKLCERHIHALQRALLHSEGASKAGVKQTGDYLGLYLTWAAAQAVLGCATDDALQAAADSYTWLRNLRTKQNACDVTDEIGRVAESLLIPSKRFPAVGQVRGLQAALCVLPASLAERILKASPNSARSFAVACGSVAMREAAVDDLEFTRLVRVVRRHAQTGLISNAVTAAAQEAERVAVKCQRTVDQEVSALGRGAITVAEYQQAEVKARLAQAIAGCFANSPHLAAAKSAEQCRLAMQLTRDCSMQSELQRAAKRLLASPTPVTSSDSRRRNG